MLDAVWVAVIAAAAFWVVAVCAAVHLMAKTARLVTEATTALTGLRDRQDLLIERANATIDHANEQLIKTGAITASMDEVTANMAELTGRVAAIAPLARVIAASAGSPLARAAALAYGLNRALWMRRSAGDGGGPGAAAARPRVLAGASLPTRRRAALTGQRDEAAL